MNEVKCLRWGNALDKDILAKVDVSVSLLTRSQAVGSSSFGRRDRVNFKGMGLNSVKSEVYDWM